MGLVVVGLAVALMATKLFVWLSIARFHASYGANVTYCVTAALMLWTYALSMATHAGPAHFAVDARVRAAEDGDEDAKDARDDGGYCERCDALKPAHVHHCSACRRCVYRMDHHCPWTHNCVGWTNKKYFLLFLLYTSACCLVFNSMVATLMFSQDPQIKAERHQHKTLLQVAWTLSLAIGGILAGYFLFHVWLLRRGKTTLEYITGKPGEFERYPFWLHVRVYFGRNPILWVLPVPPQLDARLRGRREAQRLVM